MRVFQRIKLNWAAFLFAGALLFPFLLNAQEYHFEVEAAILSNGASAQNASACSGGQQVVNIGGTSNGSVLKIFTVSKAGDYDLDLSYCTADFRSVFAWVNYSYRVEIKCNPSGGWAIPATTKIQVPLKEGLNTIVLDNKTAFGPNIDKFSLVLSPVYTISGKVELGGVGISGVQISLNGAKTATVETGEDGTYSFPNLTSGKNYNITPAKLGQVFNPPYLTFEPLTEGKTGQNFQSTGKCADCVHDLSFGTSGKIKYDTQTGTYSIFYGDAEIVSRAQSIVLNGEVQLSSIDFLFREITVEDIKDNFGSGKKMTVRLISEGLPEMLQVFYAYSNLDYFMTEVSISGVQVKSNYMAPLVTNHVNIKATGDNRFLSVPFDNDGFVRYKSNSLKNYLQAASSEVTAFYENSDRKGFVVGSVEHMVWKTGIKAGGSGRELSSLAVWGGYTDGSVTRDTKNHGYISGQVVKSPKIFVGYFDDWRIGMEEYGQANAIAEPRYVFDWDKPTPFGWNSWGAIQKGLNLEKAKAVVDFFSKSLPNFRNGQTAYIDLDSYWDNMVSGGLEGDFSNLIAFVTYCKSKGLKPGIYWAPFIDWGKWDRKVEGSTNNYADSWTKINGGYHDEDGGRAMDPTHPATKERMKFLINKFKLSGFEMIKIDFLAHATVEADSYYDLEVTTGMQAFRKGMEYLTDQLDSKMLVYAAISPNLATGRYAHTRRIACDAYGDIGSTEYTLNSNTYGWWQSKIYNFIDGDLLVFGNNSVVENRSRLTSGIINGTLITGDDFSATGPWNDRAESLFQNLEVLDVARDGIAFRPVEGNSENSASEVFVKEKEGVYDVAVVNYGESKTFDLDFSRLGIRSLGYSVKELYSGQQVNYQGTSISVNVAARDAIILHFSAGFPIAVDDPVADQDIWLYPNPASDRVFIRSKQPIESLHLTSIEGKLLKKYDHIEINEVIVDLNSYTNGLYIITIRQESGISNSYKIVKR